MFCYSIPPVKRSSAFLADSPGHGKIVGVGAVESSFLYQTTKCIDSFDHPDLPAIMVFLECLTTLEVNQRVIYEYGVEKNLKKLNFVGKVMQDCSGFTSLRLVIGQGSI